LVDLRLLPPVTSSLAGTWSPTDRLPVLEELGGVGERGAIAPDAVVERPPAPLCLVYLVPDDAVTGNQPEYLTVKLKLNFN